MNTTIKTASKARRIQTLLLEKAATATAADRPKFEDAAKLLETESPAGRWLMVKARPPLAAELVALATA